MFIKKFKGKRHWKFVQAHFNEFGINLNIAFGYPHIDLLEQIFLDVIEALAAHFECIKRKISKHFAKSDNLLFCQAIILRLEPIEITKGIKI